MLRRLILCWLLDWMLMQRLSKICSLRHLFWIYKTFKRALCPRPINLQFSHCCLNHNLKWQGPYNMDPIIENVLRRIRCQNDTASRYIRTKFTLPTSGICVFLFSVSRLALTNRRRGVFCSNFETLLFLYMNRLV